MRDALMDSLVFVAFAMAASLALWCISFYAPTDSGIGAPRVYRLLTRLSCATMVLFIIAAIFIIATGGM